MTSTEEWQARGATANLLGYDIFYMDEGAREEHRGTIFLIHGFPTASWDWDKVWPELNRHYRLVAPDMLGFGFSDKPSPHDYRIMEQADVCEALVRHLDLQEFHVLAHDYGDTVAQEMLARQNSGEGAGKWLSCMFLNGGLFPETHQALLVQKLLLGPLGILVQRTFSLRTMTSGFNRVFGPDTQPSAGEMQGFWKLMVYKDGQRNLYRLIHYMSDRKANRERWIDCLRQAVCPIGLINGSVDPVSGDHMVQRFVELVGEGYFIHKLPTIGHYPQVEDPDGVSKAYLQFLAELQD